jgi:hypothetical protein
VAGGIASLIKQPVLSGVAAFADDLAPKIPALSPKIAATFEGTPTYGPVNQMLYRAEDAVSSTTYGRWYGLAKPDSAATAEQMYNVFDYGNNLTEWAGQER